MLRKFMRNKCFQSRREDKGTKNDDKSDGTYDSVWLCSDYNRNKCKHKSNHLKMLKDRNRLLTDICATCWQIDKKKLDQPNCSSACPHQSAWLKSRMYSDYVKENKRDQEKQKLLNVK